MFTFLAISIQAFFTMSVCFHYLYPFMLAINDLFTVLSRFFSAKHQALFQCLQLRLRCFTFDCLLVNLYGYVRSSFVSIISLFFLMGSNRTISLCTPLFLLKHRLCASLSSFTMPDFPTLETLRILRDAPLVSDSVCVLLFSLLYVF